VKNWLGQTLDVGSPVYRGARQGNSSEYKVGIIESISNGKARVAWKFELGILWETVDRGAKYADGSIRYDRDFVAYVPRKLDSKGSPGLDSLVALEPVVYQRLEAIYALVEEWNERRDALPMTKQEFIDRMGVL
jgi:hypothetical protein